MMKNKLAMAALAAALLCGLAFSACKNDVQDVRIVPDTINVDAVTVALTTNKAYVIVSWDAVDDAKGYDLYFKKEGEKEVKPGPNGSEQNTYTYDPATGDQSVNPNPNKWSARISTNGGGAPQAGAYRFGVQVDGAYSASQGLTVFEIVWSDPITKE
jgi:hypothetical protein